MKVITPGALEFSSPDTSKDGMIGSNDQLLRQLQYDGGDGAVLSRLLIININRSVVHEG